MSVSEALAEWRDFYAAVAEAGGALLGLLFVAITIRLDRHPHDRHARALAMGAIVALLHPLLASLVMLMPVAAPAQGVALLVIATSGLIATVRIASFETHHPGRESRLAAAYRYFLPLAAVLPLVADLVQGGSPGAAEAAHRAHRRDRPQRGLAGLASSTVRCALACRLIAPCTPRAAGRPSPTADPPSRSFPDRSCSPQCSVLLVSLKSPTRRAGALPGSLAAVQADTCHRASQDAAE
jgi:hypothetical protein